MPRFLARLCGCVVAAAVGTTPIVPIHVAHAAGAAPSTTADSPRARELNGEGQAHFDAGNFEGAALSWSEILRILPENAVNREERDNTLLIALEAYKEAYRHRREAPGRASLEDAVAFLRDAVKLHDKYTATYARVYGRGQRISPAARTAGDEVRRMLADAERELGPTKSGTPVIKADPPVQQLVIDTTPVKRGPSGTGLIVTGAVLVAVGLGTTSMIIVGGVRARQANRERDRAREDMDQDAEDAADEKGKTANALIISGSVLTAVFFAAGFTLLGIGIHRRRRYQAFQPLIGPQFVGLGYSARF